MLRIALLLVATSVVPAQAAVRVAPEAPPRAPSTTLRISVGPGCAEACGSSTRPRLNRTGLRAVYQSLASDLVSPATGPCGNVLSEIYWTQLGRHVDCGLTVPVSFPVGGPPTALGSGAPAGLDISTDGGSVTFVTAEPIEIGDTNGQPDVYLWSGTVGIPMRVGVRDGGGQFDRGTSGGKVSRGGRHVFFVSSEVPYVRDLTRNRTIQIAESAIEGDISNDGRIVVFKSRSATLSSIPTGGVYQIYVHDRDSDGNGVFDDVGGTETLLVSELGMIAADSDCLEPTISGNGEHIGFVTDATTLGYTGRRRQVYVVAWRRGPLTIASKDGSQRPGALESGLVGESHDNLSFSDNGRYIAFGSIAETLDPTLPPAPPGIEQIYVRDRDPDGNGRYDEGNGETRLQSLEVGTKPSSMGCRHPSLSGDGKVLAFETGSPFFVAGDSNGMVDIILTGLR